MDDLRDGERFEAIVIGGGQAGLAAGYHLRRHGLEFAILDASERVGDAWRSRWDSLRLFTPAKYDNLPGMPFPAGPAHVPDEGRGGRLPRRLRAPVRPARPHGRQGRSRPGDAGRLGVRGDRGRPRARGRAGDPRDGRVPPPVRAVVRPRPRCRDPAAARQRVPPAGAASRRPGAGRRRVQLGLRDRARHRACRWPSRVACRARHRAPAVRHRGPRRAMARSADLVRREPHHDRADADRPQGARQHPVPRARPSNGPGPISSRRRACERLPRRVSGVSGGRPTLDGRRPCSTWPTWSGAPATGATTPGSSRRSRMPTAGPSRTTGVVAGVAGLYVVGLPFETAIASALLGGVWRDAAFVADRVAERAAHARAHSPADAIPAGTAG